MHRIAESARIYLRETSEEDAEEFFRLNNDPEVIKYTGDVAFESVEAASLFLSNYNQYRKFRMGRWAVVQKIDNEVLGWCGLKYHPEKDFVDLGFRLFRDHWGKGFATEASMLSLQYGFQGLGLQSVIGRADIRNEASIRVLEKAGMSPIGKSKAHDADLIIMQVDKFDFRFSNV